jgi:hypothetical protein
MKASHEVDDALRPIRLTGRIAYEVAASCLLDWQTERMNGSVETCSMSTNVAGAGEACRNHPFEQGHARHLHNPHNVNLRPLRPSIL